MKAHAARFSALFRASKKGQGCRVRELLGLGCPVMATDNFGRTPLHWSCRNGHVDVVKILLTKQASLDFRDKFGETALEMAVRYGKAPCMEVLLGHQPGGGCSLTVLANYTYRLAKFGNIEPVSHLVKCFSTDGAKTPLHEAAARGNMKAAECNLAVGSSLLRIKDKRGRTPVEVATRYGDTELVRFLLAASFERFH